MIGTVQFGMTYGIANQQGRPSRKEVLEIIKFGYEAGICDYDTAAVYGESEEVLGQSFKDLGICHKVNVFTKIKALDDEAKKIDVVFDDRFGVQRKHVKVVNPNKRMNEVTL